MKRIILTAIVAVGLGLQSCNDFLDVNTNPNAATKVDASLILPAGIVRSASLTNSYNTYGGTLSGTIANAGGFSGFGALLTYAFTPGYFSQFETAYDIQKDYRVVLDAESTSQHNLVYYKSIAEIMTAFEMHRVVDQHGDVPYSETLIGEKAITPKYDKAVDIYQDLLKRLDSAIDKINNAEFPVGVTSSSDPMFKGDMKKWISFANSLKLRLLVRISGVKELESFTKAEFAKLSNSFISDDAIVNPGYASDRMNPFYGTWGYTAAGAVSTSSRVPTYYAYGYYDGAKLTDKDRGQVIYNDFGNSSRPTPLNQLGVEQGNPAIRANYPTWYTGIRNSATSITAALGVVKGPNQGQPIMTLAEVKFLLAEAQLKGYLSGDYVKSFEDGIKASYTYLHKDVNGAVVSNTTVNDIPVTNVTTFFNSYKLNNESSHLVNIAKATSNDERLEAIITQKWIALNMITGDEAWNDYRRTGFPKSTPRGGKYVDIASTTSVATTADRLPTILRYPESEYSYNAKNAKPVNHFGDKLFWAK